MNKSATDLMQEILVSAVIDSVLALKAASKGMPNTLLRDLNAIHANTTLQDLPREVQAAIANGVRSGFNRLLKEGYSVASAQAARTPPVRREERPSRPPARSATDDFRRQPRKPGGRPPGKPGSPRPGSSRPGSPRPKPPKS